MTDGIPFDSPVRVGNFKLVRMPPVSDGPDIICVSNLDGSWKVYIPSTFEMFAMLDSLYAGYASGGEAETGYLPVMLANMMYATTIGNAYYHRALEMVATCYAFPSALDEKGRVWKDLKADASALIKAFLAWRRQWEEKVSHLSAEDEHRDAVAEQVMEYLEKEDGRRVETEADSGESQA